MPKTLKIKPMEINTIEEAKAFLKANIVKGASCPCCQQFVKLYKRKINSCMARMLISLYHYPEGFHHVGRFGAGIQGAGGGDFAKLVFLEND